MEILMKVYENSCPLCGDLLRIEPFSQWWYCDRCGYEKQAEQPELSSEDHEKIKELLNSKSLSVMPESACCIGQAISSLEPQTLTITNCEKITMHHRELDIDFELSPDRLENIDTLILNGYKYIKEKVS
jgi:DNA-directed RNA polymerase subunit M/transcription elongation factor TFIIS